MKLEPFPRPYNYIKGQFTSYFWWIGLSLNRNLSQKHMQCHIWNCHIYCYSWQLLLLRNQEKWVLLIFSLGILLKRRINFCTFVIFEKNIFSSQMLRHLCAWEAHSCWLNQVSFSLFDLISISLCLVCGNTTVLFGKSSTFVFWILFQ